MTEQAHGAVSSAQHPDLGRSTFHAAGSAFSSIHDTHPFAPTHRPAQIAGFGQGNVTTGDKIMQFTNRGQGEQSGNRVVGGKTILTFGGND